MDVEGVRQHMMTCKYHVGLLENFMAIDLQAPIGLLGNFTATIQHNKAMMSGEGNFIQMRKGEKDCGINGTRPEKHKNP